MSILGDADIRYATSCMPLVGQRDHFHVIVKTQAATVDRAKQAATEVSRLFNEGRETWWRCHPEAAAQRDFVTDLDYCAGYARFSFALRSGPHHYAIPPDPDGELRYMGLGAEAPELPIVPFSQRGFGK